MDDVFNKAGQDYPLKTHGADWNAVHKALQQQQSASSWKNNKQYSWLLLLLFAPLVCLKNDRQEKQSPDAFAKTKTAIAEHFTNHEKNIPAQIKKTEVLFPYAAKGATVANNIAYPDNAPQADAKSKERNMDFAITTGKIKQMKDDYLNVVISTNKSSSENRKIKQMPGFEKDISENIFSADKQSLPVQDISADPLKTGAPVEQKITLLNNPVIPSEITAPVAGTDSAKKQASPVAKRKLYYGLIAGPDISTIRMQAVKNVGYSAGGVIGYSINQHWSVETGILWNKKKYYTDGKHFDKAAANISSSQVFYLNGGCEMFEIPIVARYHFNRSFFATAGVSSYLMKKEDYNYYAETAGNYYYAHRAYKNSGNHLLSNVQISAGYDHSISSNIKLRVEPYLKLPIRQIGIGNMPVTSAGVYFGILHDLR